jgi:Family of unknown function (DUF5670)
MQRFEPFDSLMACIDKALPGKEGPMFLILALVLFIAWIGGFVMFKSAGLLIHLLLIFAVISIVMHFISGRRTV